MSRSLAAVKRSLLFKRTISLAVFLVGGFTQTASVAAARPTSIPFVSPKGDYVSQRDQYHTFRIPGMIVTQDGTILLFAEARRGTGRDPRREENAPIDLVMRRSTDNGDTWEPLVVIESGYRPNGIRVDFADPTPVLDRTTETVFLLYGQWPDIAPI
ncbi:glycoside hydrolase, partial [Opitutaceae bacterium]|nr:glycoside hydrolase [Opitutaceae bacterium]